jgi:tetratricopeptide (TPR) repeat protein
MKRAGVAILSVIGVLLAGAAVAQTRDENAKTCAGDNPDASVAACTALIQGGQETDEGLAIAHNNRANAYINKGDNDRAIQDLDEAVRIDPNYATAYYNRGIAYNNKDQHERAIQDFDQAIRLKSDYIAAYNNRGSAYDDLGQYERAIQDYNEVIRRDPNYGMAINNRGVAYKNLHQYERAVADYTKAISLDQSKANRWANRCWARMILGKLKEALADCDHSLKLNPTYGDAHNARGVIYLRQKKAAAAITEFDAGLSAYSSDATALYGRGLAKRMKGDKAGADADIAAATRADPNIARSFADYHVPGA